MTAVEVCTICDIAGCRPRPRERRNQMKAVSFTLVMATLVSGCTPEYKSNQEKRNKIFMECLNAVGTHGAVSFSTTKDEAIGDVVRACDSAAYYQSLEEKTE